MPKNLVENFLIVTHLLKNVLGNCNPLKQVKKLPSNGELKFHCLLGLTAMG